MSSCCIITNESLDKLLPIAARSLRPASVNHNHQASHLRTSTSARAIAPGDGRARPNTQPSFGGDLANCLSTSPRRQPPDTTALLRILGQAAASRHQLVCHLVLGFLTTIAR